MIYSRVPNNRPHTIANCSIFSPPRHLFFKPPPPPPPPPSLLLIFSHFCSHSGYVYSINIYNENDYKTFWTHFYTIFSIPSNLPPPIINNYCNVQPPIIPTPPIIRDSRVMVLDDSARMKMFTFIKFY